LFGYNLTIRGGAERFSKEDEFFKPHVGLSLTVPSFICLVLYLAQPPTFLVFR
jgi:hypothetical protein